MRRLILGTDEAIAGSIYGTIVVMAVIAAGSRGADTDVWQLAVAAVTTVIALWVAHFYAHALSDSLVTKRRLKWVEISGLARREASIPLAAIAPVGALLLSGFEVVGEQAAVRLALGIGVATLAALGVRYARIERLGSTATIIAVAINLALGLAIVTLEVLIAH